MPEIPGWQTKDPESRWRWQAPLPDWAEGEEPGAVVDHLATTLADAGVQLHGKRPDVSLRTEQGAATVFVNADADPTPALAASSAPQAARAVIDQAALDTLTMFLQNVQQPYTPTLQELGEVAAAMATLLMYVVPPGES